MITYCYFTPPLLTPSEHANRKVRKILSNVMPNTVPLFVEPGDQRLSVPLTI